MSWLDVFEDFPMHKPRVSMHDSGLAAKHDQACPVCQELKAIYRIDLSVFNPCDQCSSEGWELKQPSSCVPRWLRRAIGGQR